MLLETHLLIEVTADKSGERPGVRKHSESRASPRAPLTGSGLPRHHPSSQGNVGCEEDSMSLGPGQVPPRIPAWLTGERTADILRPQGQAFPQHIITSFMCRRGPREHDICDRPPKRDSSSTSQTPFPHKFHKGLLKAYYVQGPALSTGITKKNKAKSLSSKTAELRACRSRSISDDCQDDS